MNRERLLRLADHLDTLPAESFDMGHWGVLNPRGCGTVCCALGHACFIPEFAAEGLRLDFGTDQEPDDAGELAMVVLYRGGLWYATGYRAAAALFDIPARLAHDLFDPARYDAVPEDIHPRDVAGRIRDLVAKDGAR